MAAKITINGSDIGFGTKRFKVDRLVNKDGSYNVIKRGTGLSSFSLYYFLIYISWTQFLLLILVAYFIINCVFAFIYYAIGVEQLTQYQGSSWLDAFLHCFYFSAQTLTTVGYGFISPTDALASFVAAFEAMLGLIGFAFVTGIFYGRFSKPKAKILFSENALISPYRDITGLMFRIVNLRKNHLIEMEARFIYSYLEKDQGELKRRYANLSLEINFISMFAVPWTVVHPIEEKSPLFEKTSADLAGEEAEFIVILKGYDETFNQYVHQVYDYKHSEIVYDAKFEPMFEPGSMGMTEIFVNRIGHFRKV